MGGGGAGLASSGSTGCEAWNMRVKSPSSFVDGGADAGGGAGGGGATGSPRGVAPKRRSNSSGSPCGGAGAASTGRGVLRHTAAMQLLNSGIDTSVIALWLGHESVETTQIYLHADLALKEKALARIAPPNTTPGRYRPPDTLLAFLEAL